MTLNFIVTSSLRIKILKIDKFADFSCDIVYNSWTDVIRYVISFINDQCVPRPPQGALGGKCPLAAQRKQSKRACNQSHGVDIYYMYIN